MRCDLPNIQFCFSYTCRTKVYCYNLVYLCCLNLFQLVPSLNKYSISHNDQMVPFALQDKTSARDRCTTLRTMLKMNVGVWQGGRISHRPQLRMHCVYFSRKALVLMLDIETFSLVSMKLGMTRPAGSNLANSSKSYYSFTAFLRTVPVNCLFFSQW